MMRTLTIIVALWLFVASQVPARAEPVSIALLSALAIEATATAVAITTVVLTTAATIGISYLQTALNKSKGTEPEAPIGASSGKLTAGGIEPRRFGVGNYMTAGKLAYANTFGQDGKTPNAFLVQVIDLADLPSTGLVEIWVNGAKVTWDPNAAAGADGIAIPDFTFIGIEHLWVRFYDGRQTAADARLVSLFGNDTARPYGNRRVGFGVPYVVITARTRQEVFASFPQFKFVLAGIPLYDRRFDSTAGGSGPQRSSDPDTWVFTENPAVIRENILRGIKYDGVWQWGAQTVTAAQLPASSWMAAASECDSAVALVGGGTEPQFRAGGEIGYGLLPADVIDELNKADNGRLAEIGGVYKTRSGAPGAAVFSFTDASILSDKEQTFEPFAGMASQVNYVAAHYMSAAEGWNIKDAPALADATLEALDGRRLSTDVNYGFVTSGTQVQRLMRAERDTVRAWRRHALPMPADTFVLEPLDVVSWRSTRNGYEDKTFEITTADDLPNFNMGLAVKELDPSAYSWTPAVHQKPVIDGTITLLRPAPQPIVAWFADPYTLVGADGRERAAILLGWDADTPDVDGIRFEVRLKDTGELQLTGEEGERVFEAGELIVSHNLLPATDYEAHGQYRPASPRPVLWSGWLPVTTPDVQFGIGETPAALRNAINRVIRRLTDMEDLIGSVVGRQDVANAQQLFEKAKQIGVAKRDIIKAEAEIVVTQEDVVSLGEDLGGLTESFNGFAGPGGIFEEYTHEVVDRFEGNEGRISSVETLVVGPDSVLATVVNRVSAGLGDNTGSLAELEVTYFAFAGPEGVYAGDLLEITAALTGESDSFGGLVTLAASVKQDFIAFAGPSGTYASDHEELTAAITGTSGTLGGVATLAASVKQDFIAFAGPLGTYAGHRAEMFAAVGPDYSVVTETAEAVATIDGHVAALWTMKVDANGNFAKMMLGAGEEESDILLEADNVVFRRPGSSDLAFIMGEIDGEETFGFAGGRMLLDTETYVRKPLHVADIILGTRHLVEEAVNAFPAFSAFNSDFGLTTDTWSTLLSGTVVFTGYPGDDYTVKVDGFIKVANESEALGNYGWRVVVSGGSVLVSEEAPLPENENVWRAFPTGFTGTATGSEQSFTILLQGRRPSTLLAATVAKQGSLYIGASVR